MDGLDGWCLWVRGVLRGLRWRLVVSPNSDSSRLHSTLCMHISPSCGSDMHVIEVMQLDNERAEPTLKPPAPSASASAAPNLVTIVVSLRTL